MRLKDGAKVWIIGAQEAPNLNTRIRNSERIGLVPLLVPTMRKRNVRN